jgi:UDP:flavonoid glycosyltransferase YjiC (YdhE family)
MKILAASLGIPGHLNPVLAAASILARHHEVMVLTSNEVRAAVDATGLPFLPEPTESSTFVGNFIAAHPEFLEMPPSLEQLRFGLEFYIAANIPMQAANLRLALKTFPADLILADSFFFGTLPLLLGPRDKRPAIAHLGISVLNAHSGKNVPRRPGVADDVWSAGRERQQRALLDPVQSAFNRALHECDLAPLQLPAMESLPMLSDMYIHPGIGSFEYPDDSSVVHYIGRLPMTTGQAPLPDWWDRLDHSKRIVLVTQGTIANRDMDQLIGPALEGLANEPDVIVLVTTGGQPLDSIPTDIPSNAHVATFLPFEEIFPFIDVLVTNGGYGTVNMALAHGVPIIAAGLSEDKEEVSAHVQWAGVGIDLHTTQAEPEAVRRAVREVLDTPRYRELAREMAGEFTACNAEASLLDLVASLNV